MAMERDRLLLRGVALTVAALFVVAVLPKALQAMGMPLYATAFGRWGLLALVVAAAVGQGFALVAFSRSRAGWHDRKSLVTLLLMVVGWPLCIGYGLLALMVFASALSPGNGLFR